MPVSVKVVTNDATPVIVLSFPEIWMSLLEWTLPLTVLSEPGQSIPIIWPVCPFAQIVKPAWHEAAGTTPGVRSWIAKKMIAASAATNRAMSGRPGPISAARCTTNSRWGSSAASFGAHRRDFIRLLHLSCEIRVFTRCAHQPACS